MFVFMCLVVHIASQAVDKLLVAHPEEAAISTEKAVRLQVGLSLHVEQWL